MVSLLLQTKTPSLRYPVALSQSHNRKREDDRTPQKRRSVRLCLAIGPATGAPCSYVTRLSAGCFHCTRFRGRCQGVNVRRFRLCVPVVGLVHYSLDGAVDGVQVVVHKSLYQLGRRLSPVSNSIVHGPLAIPRCGISLSSTSLMARFATCNSPRAWCSAHTAQPSECWQCWQNWARYSARVHSLIKYPIGCLSCRKVHPFSLGAALPSSQWLRSPHWPLMVRSLRHEQSSHYITAGCLVCCCEAVCPVCPYRVCHC